jgi:hypothetical protein
VCLYVYPSIVARQGLGKNVTAATNTHVTIKEFLDVSFHMRSVSLFLKPLGLNEGAGIAQSV